VRFLHPDHDEQLELSTDDVFLNPGYFDGSSRLDADLSPPDFAGGSHPIVSANMNAVTGKRMAETMARFGGLGVLPQDMALDTVARIVKHIHAADSRFDTPLAVSPRATLRDVQGIIRKRSHDLVVVIDDDHRPIGIVTQADLRDRDQYTPAARLMSQRLVTLSAAAPTATRSWRWSRPGSRRRRCSTPTGACAACSPATTRSGSSCSSRRSTPTAADGGGRDRHLGRGRGHRGQAGRARRRRLVIDTAHGHQRRMLEALRAVRARSAIGCR
jgi:IMP dehydrogenase